LRVAATTGGATERMETSRGKTQHFTPRIVVHKMKKQVEHEGRKRRQREAKMKKKENIK
jgi:hypothetical protein